MGEQEPQDRAEPERWSADEQVGDVYEVDADEQGHVEQVRKLNPRPQIWIGSWSDYNAGVLHGAWVDAARDEADIEADIQAMLAASSTTLRTGEKAEEWGIFDYDEFGPLRLGEQEALSWVTKVARGIAEHGPAFAAYADVMQDEAALDNFSDDYLGHYDSVTAYVEQLVDDVGYDAMLDKAVPASLRPYVQIDIAALARDMQLGGDITSVEADGGGVWLFQ